MSFGPSRPKTMSFLMLADSMVRAVRFAATLNALREVVDASRVPEEEGGLLRHGRRHMAMPIRCKASPRVTRSCISILAQCRRCLQCQSAAAEGAGEVGARSLCLRPRDLSALRLEATLRESPIAGQTMVTATVGGKLIYHSAPFEADTEVSGHLKCTAWIAIDQRDTDFIVNIYDIAPDGSCWLMTEHQQRALSRRAAGRETDRDDQAAALRFRSLLLRLAHDPERASVAAGDRPQPQSQMAEELQ